MDSTANSARLNNLKVALYRNKYFPGDYLPKKIKLVDSALREERERIHLDDNILRPEDEEEIAERVRRQILENEKKRIFSNHRRPKLKKGSRKILRTKRSPVPFTYLQEHKLRKMLANLDDPSSGKMDVSQREFKKCLAHMQPTMKVIWTSPCWVMKAINECLLNRSWNNLTYLLLELIHFTGDVYKPLIRHVYAIMDQLHPVIYENDLQGEFKKIRKYHRLILNDTTVV